MGVGAAIAVGSQDEKGICALFVLDANKIKIEERMEILSLGKLIMKFNDPIDQVKAIAAIIKKSPIRLE